MDNLKGKLKKSKDAVYFGVSHDNKNDLFSRSIERVQRTNYSHSLAVYWSEDLDDFVITNAHGKAVQLDLVDEFHKDHSIVRLWECDVNQRQRFIFIKRVVQLDGVEYSSRQIFRIMWNFIFKFVFSIFHNNDKAMICSEYADQLCVAAGLPSASIVVQKNRDLLTPKDNVEAWELFSNKFDRLREVKIDS